MPYPMASLGLEMDRDLAVMAAGRDDAVAMLGKKCCLRKERTV